MSLGKSVITLFYVIIITTMITGVLVIASGVALVIFGGVGQTEIIIFGQTIKTTSVAIAAIFLGAVLVLMTMRRVIACIEKLISKIAGKQK